MLPEVRTAHVSDVGAIAAMLGRAFHDDAVAHFIFPADEGRVRNLERFFEIQMRHHYFTRGEVYTTRDCAGAALWIPPIAPPVRPKDALAQLGLVRVVWGRFRATRRLVLLLAARHPKVAHYYLATIGVEPNEQHCGLGSALMQPVLQRCDAKTMPAYLECSNEANIAFYREHGFVVTEELHIPSGPRIWLMWRAADKHAIAS